MMEAKSKQKFIRMPARKMRRVINEIRGKCSRSFNYIKVYALFRR
jgi:ribosomal protein L22